MGLGLRRGRNIPGALGLSLTTLPTLPTPPRQSPTDVHKAQVPRSKTVLKREPPHPTGPVSADNSFGKEGKTDLVSLLTFFFFYSQRQTFSVM